MLRGLFHWSPWAGQGREYACVSCTAGFERGKPVHCAQSFWVLFFVVVGVTFSTMPAQTTMSQASVTLPPARAPRPLSVPVLPLPGPLACPPLSVLGCCLVQSSPCAWAAGTVTLMEQSLFSKCVEPPPPPCTRTLQRHLDVVAEVANHKPF